MVAEKASCQALIKSGWTEIATAERTDGKGAKAEISILKKQLDKDEYVMPNYGFYGTHILKK